MELVLAARDIIELEPVDGFTQVEAGDTHLSFKPTAHELDILEAGGVVILRRPANPLAQVEISVAVEPREHRTVRRS